MTNPLQGSDEETPPTFAEMISQLEMCTHMDVTSTSPDESQQWHARRNKARLALSAKLDSLESALREARETVRSTLVLLDGYVAEVRNDWSEFDGRQNRSIVNGIVAPLRAFALPDAARADTGERT